MYITLSECNKLNNKPFKHIVHIGAHDGAEITDYANNGIESVVWVEASRRFMAPLYENTRKYTGVKQEYLNVCLSDVEGEEITFNISSNGQSSSMLELGTHATLYPHITYTGKETVITKRFDKLSIEKKLNIDRVDFINLDVQGAELKVLKGFGDLLSSTNLKAIYTEINFEEVYKGCCLAADLDGYLAPFGFKRVLTRGECKEWGDALYLCK